MTIRSKLPVMFFPTLNRFIVFASYNFGMGEGREQRAAGHFTAPAFIKQC